MQTLLQQFIEEAKDRQKAHQRTVAIYKRGEDGKEYWQGREHECAFWLEKLTFLLEEEPISEQEPPLHKTDC